MSQMKNTIISIGKTKKTLLLAVFLIIALVVTLSLSKLDNSEVLAQRPGGGAGQRPGAGGGMPAMPPTMVRVEAVGSLDSTQPVPKVGTVAAKETVQIVPRVSGYLLNVAFQEGDYVKEGDLLFEIEDTVYKINVRVAESVIKQIEAEIALAKRNHERVEQLVLRKTSPEQELDEALRTISLHEARLEEAKARLDQAENDLGYTKIYAPLNGRIGAKQFSIGNYLTPASGVLATIMQFDPITVTFPVTEREFTTYFHEAGENRKEAKVELLLADGKPYEGEFRIDFLDNYVDRFSGQLMVYLLCENKTDKLYPGGFTTVKLSEKFEEPKPAVNVAALMTDGVTHYVYVMQMYQKETEDDKGNKVFQPGFRAVRRDVTLGQQVFDRQVVISGLTPGEQVVVGGLNKIMMSGQDIMTQEMLAAAMQAQAAQANQAPQVKQQEMEAENETE